MKKVLFLILIGLLSASCQATTADKQVEKYTTKTLNTASMLTLTSPAFLPGQKIPKKYTCQGENINPALEISDAPQTAKSLALIMDDPDVPKNLKPDGVFDHWVVFNLPPDTKSIPENSNPPGALGSNGRGEAKYTGPCPPDREHRYFFRLYALDTVLSLPEGSTKQEVLNAITGHILQQAELMGTYVKD